MARLWQECQHGRAARSRRARTSVTSMYSSGTPQGMTHQALLVHETCAFSAVPCACVISEHAEAPHMLPALQFLLDPYLVCMRAGAMEALLEDIKGQRAAADLQLAAARCFAQHVKSSLLPLLLCAIMHMMGDSPLRWKHEFPHGILPIRLHSAPPWWLAHDRRLRWLAGRRKALQQEWPARQAMRASGSSGSCCTTWRALSAGLQLPSQTRSSEGLLSCPSPWDGQPHVVRRRQSSLGIADRDALATLS